MSSFTPDQQDEIQRLFEHWTDTSRLSVLVRQLQSVTRIGDGSPETVVTAPVSTLFLRGDGAPGSVFYVKTSGTGNTGWTAVA